MFNSLVLPHTLSTPNSSNNVNNNGYDDDLSNCDGGNSGNDSKLSEQDIFNKFQQSEIENKKLREYIRERYGIEAEKEADFVVATWK